ncbi:zinc finger FYVE domain-containing protein 26-like [Dendropsophus ebraccatus]|uniref:zinc finger FYVE domain-containing protein 26-like n=1 Tax=Dendropsophus ebraccatus TaxID=150705 RepID=UPI0038316968
MSRSPPSFGEEEEEAASASFSRLREFFGRCLRKGHWELARACLAQLSRGPDAGEVEEILGGLVRAPHLLSCDEEHTPQKLAWFWLNALELWLGRADKLLPDILKDETEFLLLLEEFQKGTTEQTVKELYDAFLYSHSENRREKPSPRFSAATVSSLWGCLSQNPRLVQSLIGFLLVDDSHPASMEYNHYLLNITVNFLLDLLSSLQKEDEAGSTDRHSASCTVNQVFGVLSTMHYNTEVQAAELRRLCEELFVCADKGILPEDAMQACLLRKQNCGLVSLYGTVSSEKIRAQITTLKSPGKGSTPELCDTERAVLTLFYDPEQVNPWKKIYFYSISTGKHFLEQIVVERDPAEGNFIV